MIVKVLVGAILLRDGAVLLGKRAPNRAFYPSVWDVFGGHVEAHETVEEALVRELQEELGITPTRFTELAVVDYARSKQREKYKYHLYQVTQWTGTPENALLEEHSEIRWVPLDEAPRLDLAHPAYRSFFQALAQGSISQ